jgi:hypothetical protein
LFYAAANAGLSAHPIEKRQLFTPINPIANETALAFTVGEFRFIAQRFNGEIKKFT